VFRLPELDVQEHPRSFLRVLQSFVQTSHSDKIAARPPRAKKSVWVVSRDMLENPNANANALANILPAVDSACFDQRWVLGAQIGRDTSSNFALSFDGELTIRTADNRFVVPERGPGGNIKLIDVTCLTLNADPYVFRIPVSVDSIRPGQILVRSDSPF